MNPLVADHPLIVVVGAGGVGKTTLAAALGLEAAAAGSDTLVMTFDPSLRLKDALGVREDARDAPVKVQIDKPGELWASLLDAQRTFDRLIERYAPDERSRERILQNGFYRHLAGSLGGVLEYMAVERLYEVAREERYRHEILDTPPTRQALDFLEAPQRIVDFLDSGAIRLAMRGWFDEQGRLKPTSRLGFVGRSVEGFLDRIVGLDLLRDVAEFFEAFGPLYDGFRSRAVEVQQLLRSERTLFLLVTGPGRERIAETLFFARKLGEAGYRVGPLIVNRIHPVFPEVSGDSPAALFQWLGRRDREGLDELAKLLPGQPPVHMPLLPEEPSELAEIERVGRLLGERLKGAGVD